MSQERATFYLRQREKCHEDVGSHQVDESGGRLRGKIWKREKEWGVR